MEIFQPHPSEHDETEELVHILENPYQLEPSINCLKRAKVQAVINSIHPKKSPECDLIIDKILKELLTIGIQYLTQLFYAVLLKEYFPAQCKVAQIILILKPGKSPHELASSQPISVLSIVSKIFEKLLLTRILPIIEKKKQTNTQAPVWLPAKALNNRTDVSNIAVNKRSHRKHAILFCGIHKHHTSMR
jgi:hypothetical protein